jgi:proteasome lid subunit RPN8/RPN11
MWQSTCGRYNVRITRRAFRSMLALAARHIPNEVGTPLVGSYSDDGHRAAVHAIAPLPDDSHGSPSSFIRGIRGLGAFFGRLVARFRGRRHYVGEWHSHPGGSSTASPTDDRNQAAIAADPKADCPESVLIIVGGEVPTAPTLGLYVYSRAMGKIVLHPREHRH